MFKQLKLTYIYYAVPSVIFTALFFSLYSVKKLCWDLDTFLMTGDLKSLITLLVGGALFFIALSRTIKFYGVFVNARRVKRFNNFLYGLKSSFGVFGEQGCGKSLTMTYIMYVLQPAKFFDLCYEVYRKMPVKEYLKEQSRKGGLFQWKLFKSREQSLNFYIRNLDKFIPCLYAFKEQTITMGGLRSYELKKEHFTKELRLPENNILAGDEFGDRFNNATRHKSKAGKSDEQIKEIELIENTFAFASTQRQVTNGMTILADQRKGDISIAFKGTCAKKWFLVSFEERYKPQLLQKLENRLKNKIVRLGGLLYHPEINARPKRFNADKTFKKYVKAIKRDNRLNAAIAKIGFFKIGYYEESGGEEIATLSKDRIYYYSIPCNLPFSFNSRGYMLTDNTLAMKLKT